VASAPTSDGAFDHVAFRHTAPDALLAVLSERGIPHRENRLPEFGIRQIVVHDPAGIMIELNCAM
jgi:hypothetical protein